MAINLDCIRFVAKMKWELVANDILRVHFWNVNGCVARIVVDFPNS